MQTIYKLEQRKVTSERKHMLKILGIFTCYNRKEKTKQCLESLIKENSNINFSFIAVDDQSSDGTAKMLQQCSNVKLIRGDGNCFYSGGMRLGIKEAKKYCREYEWVLLFNDDVAFVPQAIEKLEALSIDRKEILVGATCDGQGILSYGGVLQASRYKPDFRIVMSGKEKVYCDTFNANCVLIPTSVFQKLPNIDDIYTHSLGDFDYGLEAHKLGIPILVSDFFVGTCCDNPLTGTWRDVSLTRRERLKKKESPKGLPRREWFHFVKKHYGFISACWSSVTPYVKILLRMP